MRKSGVLSALVGALACCIAIGTAAARAEDAGGQRGLVAPPAYRTPVWVWWRAMRFDSDSGGYLRLAADSTVTEIGRVGQHFRVIVRARLDAPAGGGGRMMVKVGNATRGFACGYDESAGQLVFGVKDVQSYVMRCPFVADGAWHNFEFRFNTGEPGHLYVDGASRPLSFEGGMRGASLTVTAPSSSTVGAVDGGNPLEALVGIGAGAVWSGSAGANRLEGEVAYLRIERYPNGYRDLEMYFNEGAGAPRDFTNDVTPVVIGAAEWVEVEQPSYIRRWPLQTPGEEFMFGCTISTDEDGNPDSPTTTVPMIVEAPGGGMALRCRVFSQWGKHSEWRVPVPTPTALDTYLAFDIYVDGTTMSAGGNPYHNWMHWLRVGEAPLNEPAIFIGHHDHDIDGIPGVRVHVVSGPVPTFTGDVPLSQWKRVLLRYRSGRDLQGSISLSDGVNTWAMVVFSKDDTGEIRLRARADGTPGTIYFRNVALGTDPQEVMFGAEKPQPAETCGVLIEQGGCVMLAGDDGLVYAVENVGSFSVGDRVAVGGLLDEHCESACPVTGGCFIQNTIDPCFIGCGKLVEGPGGCLLLRTEGGQEYAIENIGLYVEGDWVFAIGRVDATGGGLCPAFKGPAIMGNGVVRCYSACGDLEDDAQSCLTFVVLNGDRFRLENTASYASGARVFVRGRVEPGAEECGGTVYALIDTNSIRSCSPDFNGDGLVNAADLAVLLGAWGLFETPEDLNGDGVVNAGDLAVVLGAWG